MVKPNSNVFFIWKKLIHVAICNISWIFSNNQTLKTMWLSLKSDELLLNLDKNCTISCNMSVDAGICVKRKQFYCKWMFDIRYNFPRNSEDIVETKELLSNRKYILKVIWKNWNSFKFSVSPRSLLFSKWWMNCQKAKVVKKLKARSIKCEWF